jgi:hypothetical protein
MVSMGGDGELRCAEAKGLMRLPAAFDNALILLEHDLDFALDCIPALGGIPRPVAQALSTRLEVAQCALYLALHGTAEGKAN